MQLVEVSEQFPQRSKSEDVRPYKMESYTTLQAEWKILEALFLRCL
jgi:hypothetical protein